MEPFTSGLMSLEKARLIIAQSVSPLADSEILLLDQASDRVTAEAVISPLPIPGFDNSAMDGYAVCAADMGTKHPLLLTATLVAGSAYRAH